MSKEQVLFQNQFRSGTTIKLSEMITRPDGTCDFGIHTFCITSSTKMEHNDFELHGKLITPDEPGIHSEERRLGRCAYITGQMLDQLNLPRYGGEIEKDLFKKAVESGIIVQGTGPLIQKPTGFCYNHFPKGTLFTLDYSCFSDSNAVRKHKVFEVVDVTMNGPGSFIVTTTTPSSEIYTSFGDSGIGFSVNIDLVNKIVKRGTGKVVFGKRHIRPISFIRSPYTVSMTAATGKCKTNYVGFDEYDIVNQSVFKLSLPISCQIDGVRLIQALKKQYFVKRNGHVCTANRKRLDRWIKQNINRFMMTIVDAVDRDNAEYSKMCQDDYNDFDD